MPNYSGIWTEQAVMQAVGAGNWPGNPGAPTIGTATAGDASASVTFTAPTNNGGSAITSYTVTSSPGSLTGTGASSPVTVSGLTNGTAYTFTVTATNATGTGPASAASNSVTPAAPVYIEDVYSTYIYTGNGSTQTITNGIDLSGKGGLVWIKRRDGVVNHYLATTNGGTSNYLNSNTTNDYETSVTTRITSFNTDGFSLGSAGSVNNSGSTFVGWTFREQAKFFDVVTYTGNGDDNRNIAHNLGAVPGCIIVKETGAANGWAVYHRTLADGVALQLQSTGTSASTNFFGPNSAQTSTVFQTGNANKTYTNGDTKTYVAYLFAHDAGGFGLTGTDNVISCGSIAVDASGNGSANLGYEPQWVLAKDITNTQRWLIFDTMRGFPNAVANGTDAVVLAPNTTAAEAGFGQVGPTATGWGTNAGQLNASSTYIYIAIRRGPMKVPTVGTNVFSPVYVPTVVSGTKSTTGFPIDLQILSYTAGTTENQTFVDRLRGISTTDIESGRLLISSSTAAEATTPAETRFWDNTGFQQQNYFTGGSAVYWNFKRAPGFFDEVCYTGTGSVTTFSHNLAAVPELMIFKRRSNVNPWMVYCNRYNGGVNANQYYQTLNSTDSESSGSGLLNNTNPTSSVFTVGTWNENNASGSTFVAYLFATCAGVSKVGGYTGTGATLQIDCGFTAGARFVLIKRANASGAWYVWDSARGIIAGNDPYLLLNSTAAEVTNTDYVDTYSAGFEISSTAPAAINASGGTYIFLAIA
jgi:hypothetical protein